MKLLNLLLLTTLGIQHQHVFAKNAQQITGLTKERKSVAVKSKKLSAKEVAASEERIETEPLALDEDHEAIEYPSNASRPARKLDVITKSVSAAAGEQLSGALEQIPVLDYDNVAVNRLRFDQSQSSASVGHYNSTTTLEQGDSKTSSSLAITPLNANYTGVLDGGIRAYGQFSIISLASKTGEYSSTAEATLFGGGAAVGLNKKFGLGLDLTVISAATVSLTYFTPSVQMMLGTTDVTLSIGSGRKSISVFHKLDQNRSAFGGFDLHESIFASRKKVYAGGLMAIDADLSMSAKYGYTFASARGDVKCSAHELTTGGDLRLDQDSSLGGMLAVTNTQCKSERSDAKGSDNNVSVKASYTYFM